MASTPATNGETRVRGVDWAGVACLGTVAALTALSLGRPFGNGDEVIYAQSVREMLQSGDLWTLRWQGVQVLQRPTTPFLPTALVAKLWPDEVGLRLMSFLWCMATLLLVYRHLRRRFGRADVAVTGVLLCAGIPTFAAYDHLLMSDPPFVFGTTLAVVALLRAVEEPERLRGVGAGLGWATACKSLAVVIPAAVLLLPTLWVVRRHRAQRLLLQAVGIALALALPYYVLGFALHGMRFWEEHVVYSLWRRAAGTIGVGNAGGPDFYLRWLWYVDGPASAAWLAAGVVGALVQGVRGRRPEWLILGWIAPAMWLSYSALGSRLPHYILPAWPVAALGAAYAYATASDRFVAGAALRAWYAPVGALGLLLFALGQARAEVLLMYDDAAVQLGRVAAQQGDDQPIVVHEWYAPTVAYYAKRPLLLSTAAPERFAALEAVDFFRAAGVQALTPPAPAAPGTTMWVAAPAAALQRQSWLRIDALVARAGPYVLVRATALPVQGASAGPVNTAAR